MTPAPTFRDEVLNHLEEDILSFGWLRQMAERDFEYPVGTASRQTVIDLVRDLVDARIVVVGTAHSNGSLVTIRPWVETGEALVSKMNRELDSARPEDSDWGFWIQLVQHYNRK